MAICITNPIEQDKFNKLVLGLTEVLGEKEAKEESARDYFEQNEMVRPSSVVLKKIQDRKNQEQEILSAPKELTIREEEVVVEQEEDASLELEKILNSRNSEVSEIALDDMTSRLGIPYSFVTESQAINKGAGTSKGFYRKGHVYFVSGRFTPETVFHEFSHPVVKSMAIDDPELFNKLYNDVLNNDWGKGIDSDVREDVYYKEQDESNIRQEIIVRSLTYMNENAIDNRTLLDKFLYRIRQFLRKVFGKKINVGKLSTSTSLEDIIAMMNESENFELNKDFLKLDDVLMLEKEYKKTAEELDKDASVAAQIMMNEFRNTIKEQVGLMQKDRGIYNTISEDLINDQNTGLLQVINKAMNELSTELGSTKNTLTTPLQDSLNDPQAVFDRLENFIEVISKTGAVLKKYTEVIDNMGDTVINYNDIQMDQLQAISKFADVWKKWFTDNELVMATSISERLFPVVTNTNKETGETTYQYSEGRKQFLQIRDYVNELKTKVDNKRYNVITEITYAQAKEEFNDTAKEYEKELERLLDMNAFKEYGRTYWAYHGVTIEEQNTIDIIEEEKANSPNNEVSDSDEAKLEKLKRKKLTGYEVTKEGIRSLLENEGPDASFFNNYWDSYSSSQDKIVGGFFKFMHNHLKEVSGNVNKAQNDFLYGTEKNEGINELLDKAGVLWRTNLGEGYMGRYVGKIVNVGKKSLKSTLTKYKKDKPEIAQVYEIEDWEEWQFQSNFGGHEPVILQLNLDIENAQRDYNKSQSPEKEKAYREALAKKDQFLIDYMTQDKVPEFYSYEYLFKDEIGIKAKATRDKWFEEKNLMIDSDSTSSLDAEAMDAMKKKYREYRYLHSTTDMYGVEKTGDELNTAERLSEYRKKTKDFYEYKDIPSKFQDAYNDFIFDLENQTPALKSSDISYQNKLNEWLENHTVTEVIGDYFDTVTKNIDERSELLKPFHDLNASIKDIGPMFKEIARLSSPSRDEQGHYDGNELTLEVQSKIQKISQEIEDARKDLYTTLGLTRAQLDEFTEITNFKEKHERFESDNAEAKFNFYSKKMSEGLSGDLFNISRKDAKRILELDEILRQLTYNNYTRAYINKVEQLLDLEPTREIFEQFLDEVNVDRDRGGILTEGTVDKLLNPEYQETLNELLVENDAFEKWFKNNHYQGVRVVPIGTEGKKSPHMIYIKTSLWSYSRPKDIEFYKSFPLEDDAGNIIGSLKYQGLPRVPNMQYKERVVKPEYITKEILTDKIGVVNGVPGQLILANKNPKTRQWLPRTVEDGAIGKDFINEEYMDIFKNNRPKWDVIQYAKTTYLKFQNGMEQSETTGISFPKIRHGNVEKYQKGFFFRRGDGSWIKSFMKGRMMESVVRIFQKRDDDIENDMSFRDYNENISYKTLTRPVSGTYDLHINDVSTNIFAGMFSYKYSVEYYKALRKINSYSSGLREMVNSNAREKGFLEKLGHKSRQVLFWSSGRQDSNRAWAINNIIEEYFEGVKISGKDFTGKKTIAEIMNHVSSTNSRKWFSWNWHASATNLNVGKLQMYQKTWDKRFPSAKNLAIGSAKSIPVLAQLGLSSYSKKVKPLQIQLLNVMNALPDNIKSQAIETANRNIATDIGTGKLGYITRRNSQNHIEMQAFYSLADKGRYKFRINGKGPLVSLDQSVHLVKGVIESVPGVPKDFRISYNADGKIVLGKKIKEIIGVQENYLFKIVGMSGHMSESELLSRALIGKYSFSLFKWLPPMLMDRVAFKTTFQDFLRGRYKPRFNYHTRSVEYGRVVGAFDAIRQFTNTGFRYVNHRQVADAFMMATWFVLMMGIKLAIQSIRFNVGGDDEESEENTGEFVGFDPYEPGYWPALKNSFTLPETSFIDKSRRTHGKETFDWIDYPKAHLLRQLVRTNRENNAFMLFNTDSGGGILPILYNIARMKSPQQEGTLQMYADLATILRTELSNHPEKNLITVPAGPYDWQQQDMHKFPKWYMDYRGITGAMPDPWKGLKGEAMNL